MPNYHLFLNEGVVLCTQINAFIPSVVQLLSSSSDSSISLQSINLECLLGQPSMDYLWKVKQNELQINFIACVNNELQMLAGYTLYWSPSHLLSCTTR